MAKAMLKLENIVKDYKVADTVVHALKGVSLSFRKNDSCPFSDIRVAARPPF